MNVENIIDGNAATISVSSRMDTVTAPMLQQAVDSLDIDINELTLDFKELEYTSSAGLRVILAAQKKMNRQGSMKLINVNDVIMDVLDVTGFIDILTIE